MQFQGSRRDAAVTERPPRQPSTLVVTTVALFAIVVIGMVRFGITAVGFLREAPADAPSTLRVLFAVLIVGTIVVATPVVAWVALRTGWIAAPIIVTLVGIWSISELWTWADSLAVVSAVIGAAAIIGSWMPPTRQYLRDRTRWLQRGPRSVGA